LGIFYILRISHTGNCIQK